VGRQVSTRAVLTHRSHRNESDATMAAAVSRRAVKSPQSLCLHARHASVPNTEWFGRLSIYLSLRRPRMLRFRLRPRGPFVLFQPTSSLWVCARAVGIDRSAGTNRARRTTWWGTPHITSSCRKRLSCAPPLALFALAPLSSARDA
jgi:hypothetical protein